MTRMLMASNAPPRSTGSTLFDKAKFAADWLRAARMDPDLFIVVAFCGIGLFVAILAAFLGEPS